MEDEHQSTLKKKIQILFQLGKWPDVIKLCQSFGEKYGKDAEVEAIRFKCERHLGIAASGPQAPAPGEASAAASRARPSHLPHVDDKAPDPSIPLIPPTPSDELAPESGDKMAYDAQPELDEVDIGDPFADNELLVTDPFAQEEPGLRLAPDEPPVIISDGAAPGAAPDYPRLEMERSAEPDNASADGESEPDFGNMGPLTIDAEPDLLPSSPAVPQSPTEAEEKPRLPASMYVPTPVPMPPPVTHERSRSDRFDVVEEPEEKKRPKVIQPEEEQPRPRGSMFTAAPEPEAPAKKPFNLKLVLLIALPLVLAIVLWLYFSGKLNFGGAEPAPAAPPAAERPLPRRPRRVQPATPPAATPAAAQLAAAQQAAAQEAADQDFAAKLKQAEELNRNGDLLNAWAALLEAKKIKVTEPLKALEEELARKMSEAQAAARQENEAAKSESEKEGEALSRAREADTIETWRNFLRAYPEGEFAAQAQRRIVILEKKAAEAAQQQLRLRIQQAQKVRLRAEPLNLSPAELAAQTGASGRPAAQYEVHANGGATVTIDLTTGLMWSLYTKPMAYDKAEWWANRITAGYSGWRLPTVEEALTLLQMERGQYAGLADFAVWTCDSVSNQARSAWTLRLPAGQFAAAAYGQLGYVWAVRKAGR
jgi:hypothetical protein